MLARDSSSLYVRGVELDLKCLQICGDCHTNPFATSCVIKDGRKTTVSEDELSGDEIYASNIIFRAVAALTVNDHARASLPSSVAVRPYYYQMSALPESAAFLDRSAST